MNCVQSIDEILQNINTLDAYVNAKTENSYSWALERIQMGSCFVAYMVDGKYRFYPSRFIGYSCNSMDVHQNNDTKDGRITNRAIEAVLHQKASYDADLEKSYMDYCESLGMPYFNKKRKYWNLMDYDI